MHVASYLIIASQARCTQCQAKGPVAKMIVHVSEVSADALHANIRTMFAAVRENAAQKAVGAGWTSMYGAAVGGDDDAYCPACSAPVSVGGNYNDAI